jgi:uncharacterized protein (TIGR02646 family)
MIRIYRPDTIPPSLQPKKIALLMKKMEAFYLQSSDTKKRQTRFEFDITPVRAAKEQLAKEFNHKCAYCESPIERITDADLEFFRPKSAKGLNDEFSNDHYWWLYYEWKNIFYCCSVCNRTKSNWFPVEGKRIPVKTPYAEGIKKENNLLIDPCNEDPEAHLDFNFSGSIFPRTQKGKWTIETLQLNRHALREARKMSIRSVQGAITKLFTGLLNKLFPSNKAIRQDAEVGPTVEYIERLLKNNSEIPYAGALRNCLKRIIMTYPRKDRHIILEYIEVHILNGVDSDYYSILMAEVTVQSGITEDLKVSPPIKITSKKVPKTKDVIKRLTIDRLVIHNFRAIEDMEIVFPKSNITNIDIAGNMTASGRNNWLMLLGENGVGKSSFLQAIVLSLAGSKYLAKLDISAKDILRRGAEKGFVKVYTVGNDVPIGIEFSKRSAKITSTHTAPQGYLIAYGSTRLLTSKNLKPEPNAATRNIRAMNLFDPSYALYGNQWLVSLSKTNKAQFDYACRALMDILSEELNDPEAILKVEKGEIIVTHARRQPDKLKELSDGYKSIIATACDMMSLLLRAGTMESAEGLVIIDEIGTHLHPRWRMRVVESFRKTFPHMQFIATTHDPLCLRGLNKSEVVIFKKDKEDHKIYAITDLPDPSKMRVDQLLTSEFFGLNSVIDPAEEKLLNEYHFLLSKARPTREQKDRIAELETALKPYQELGNTWREALVYKAVDEVVAMSKLKMPGEYKTGPKNYATESNESFVVNDSGGGNLATGNDLRKQAEDEVKARIRAMWDKNKRQ